MYFDQAGYDLKFEWGLEGWHALQSQIDAVIIVDVLSFSTAVDIALSNGASILPYPWKDETAERFAAANSAILAGRRGAAGFSLSPASLRTIPSGTRLVLPSPNGSTIAAQASGVQVFSACVRNARAVARHVAAYAARIAVIAAGEQWPEGRLRPCLEDHLGAGAVLAELPGNASPEAEAAVAAFQHFRDTLHPALMNCASGRELIERGFTQDVDLAAEYSVSTVVPLLVNGEFTAAVTSSSPEA